MTRIALVALLGLPLASCGTLNRQLADASAQKAVAEAATVLPSLPAECYRDTPHGPRTIGEDAPAAARAEYRQVNVANGSKRRCVAVYTDLQRALGPH